MSTPITTWDDPRMKKIVMKWAVAKRDELFREYRGEVLNNDTLPKSGTQNRDSVQTS